MSEDAWLLALTGAVWAALAALYALVPAFHMPGSALVWGCGAVLFTLMAAAAALAERGAPRG